MPKLDVVCRVRSLLLLGAMVATMPAIAQDTPQPSETPPDGTAGRQLNRSMFPGFRYSQEEIYTYEDPDALPGDLPFEAEVRRRNRRIDLGLDRPQRSSEPVDNVLNFKF